ncbi:MAG: hypothetical protein AB7N61_13325 [Acidimicrobiia bacterium]
MNDTWEARFVDKQVDRAWMDLRLRLADRFAAGMAGEDIEPLDITTATGETLSITVDDEYVVVVAGDNIYTTANVDEAAYTVFQVLHDDWQVVHPIFLDTEIVAATTIADNPVGQPAVAVPVLGSAESREQLQVWVEATFQEGLSEKLRVARNVDIPWASRRGDPIVVSVRNDSRIELWTVLGREVSFKKARKAIDRLSAEYFGIKFYLRQDVLIMSRTLLAKPYVADHLTSALRDFTRVSDRLGGVAEEVLRERVKVERALVAEAEQAKATAEAALAESEERARRAVRAAERRKMERAWVSRNLKRAQEERDAAQAELASLKSLLEKALGHQDFPGRTGRGDAA